jgi:hypothetical protein
VWLYRWCEHALSGEIAARLGAVAIYGQKRFNCRLLFTSMPLHHHGETARAEKQQRAWLRYGRHPREEVLELEILSD